MRTHSIVQHLIGITAIGIIFLLTCSALPHQELNEYGRWLAFHKLDDRDFDTTSEPKEMKIKWEDHGLDTSLTNLYLPLFIYSPDSSFFIDLDSYSLDLETDETGSYTSSGVGVDTKVQLVNRATNKSVELIFCGTECYAETAVWFSDYLVQITGFKINEEDEYMPTLLRIDLKENLVWHFESKRIFKKKPASYVYAFRYAFINFED